MPTVTALGWLLVAVDLSLGGYMAWSLLNLWRRRPRHGHWPTNTSSHQRAQTSPGPGNPYTGPVSSCPRLSPADLASLPFLGLDVDSRPTRPPSADAPPGTLIQGYRQFVWDVNGGPRGYRYAWNGPRFPENVNTPYPCDIECDRAHEFVWCQCGLYLMKSFDVADAPVWLGVIPPYSSVDTLCMAWGTVVETEHGYRATHGEVIAVVCKHAPSNGEIMRNGERCKCTTAASFFGVSIVRAEAPAVLPVPVFPDAWGVIEVEHGQ